MQNHELVRISLQSPFLTSIGIYSILLGLSFLALYNSREGTFLNRGITQQVRGAAILLVVVGHIGYHTLVSRDNFLVLGDYGVSIFFVLSGFGLARSYPNRALSVREFFVSRVSRVMVPYWIATAIILILDFILIDRKYDISTVLLTVCGINISMAARHLDYVRWYITASLIWYVFFALYWGRVYGKKLILLFFVTGVFLILSNYYVVPIGYGFLSFPFGVALGVSYDWVRYFFARFPGRFWIFIAICIFLSVYTLEGWLLPRMESMIPYLAIVFLKEMILISFTVAALIVFSIACKNNGSVFLRFAGAVSYELFLFHGVFMVKYDFILFKGPMILAFWPYLCFMVIISSLIQKAARGLQKRINA